MHTNIHFDYGDGSRDQRLVLEAFMVWSCKVGALRIEIRVQSDCVVAITSQRRWRGGGLIERRDGEEEIVATTERERDEARGNTVCD